MSEEKPLISILIPVLNEEDSIKTTYARVKNVLAALTKYSYEIIFTDNHSTDNSFTILQELAKKDEALKIVRFSKNFGYQKSIFAGYLLAKGTVAIQLDCDLQDPPELIPKMIELWQSGYEVVYGVRESRKEGKLIEFSRKFFYRLINWLSEDYLPLDAGDFRLVDRKVIDVLPMFKDDHPYIRGVISSVGFRQKGFDYSRAGRVTGQSKFNFSALLKLALDGILNHSIKPLQLASLFAMVLALVMIISIIIYTVGKIVLNTNWPAGFATTTILILFGMLLNALFLGIIGEYLGRIYTKLQKKPFVIVEQYCGQKITEDDTTKHIN